MSDQFTSQYEDLLEGQYDCVDRIVVNAWLPGCGNGGGFRNWWRSLHGSDEKLDDEHLMRMTGRFSRRLRAWPEVNKVPVVDCGRGERKHVTAEEFLPERTPGPGLFFILVGKAPGPVWHVTKTSAGKIGYMARKEPLPHTNHYRSNSSGTSLDESNSGVGASAPAPWLAAKLLIPRSTAFAQRLAGRT